MAQKIINTQHVTKTSTWVFLAITPEKDNLAKRWQQTMKFFTKNFELKKTLG